MRVKYLLLAPGVAPRAAEIARAFWGEPWYDLEDALLVHETEPDLVGEEVQVPLPEGADKFRLLRTLWEGGIPLALQVGGMMGSLEDAPILEWAEANGIPVRGARWHQVGAPGPQPPEREHPQA